MATETEGGTEEDAPANSTLYVMAVRLSFLTAGFVLAALYVENTYGRIRLGNLYYPYFVISMLGLVGLTVYAEELRRLVGRDSDRGTAESVKAAAREWWRSIGLVLIGLVYLFAIDKLGFFISSALAMIALMVVGGLRDTKQIVGVTVLVLALVYLLFVRLMGLQPPEGAFGI